MTDDAPLYTGYGIAYDGETIRAPRPTRDGVLVYATTRTGYPPRVLAAFVAALEAFDGDATAQAKKMRHQDEVDRLRDEATAARAECRALAAEVSRLTALRDALCAPEAEPAPTTAPRSGAQYDYARHA